MMKAFLISGLLLVPMLESAFTASADKDAFFEKRIRPLLVEHCLECHGPDKQKGSLRLDHQVGWKTGGDSGPAILPGRVEESLLWRAVNYEDRDLKMPPKKRLSDAELADLREWIGSGAHDPRLEAEAVSGRGSHSKVDGTLWSFQPPVIKPLPAVKKAAWVANPIDQHILARLEAEGLSPAPDAEPMVLRRRLAFDLTGMPPVADSMKDSDLATYVDGLLASPAFAERWASHFMDMTRFAESSGGGRSLPFKDAWRFRDYLIESIRDNTPLDRMITEMIAGDILPYTSASQRRRQVTATGFLALGPTNYEEQDKGMLRMDIVDEQMETIGRSFLGMTLGCARCHDHKFDPIPTRDYYAMAGILRSTKTLKNYTDNVAHWIDTPLLFEGAEEARLVALEKETATVEKEVALLKDQLRDAGSVALRRKKRLATNDLPGTVVDDADAQKVGNWKSSSRFPPFIGGGYLHDENQGRGEKTLTFTPKLPVAGRYEVRVAFSGGPGRAERVPATVLHADGEDLVYFKQTTEALDGLQFATIGTWRFEIGGQNFVMISNAGAEGYVTVDAVQFLPAEAGMPDMPAQKVSEEENDLRHRLADMEKKLKEIRKAGGPSRPEVMSVAEDEKPEDARIHIRGSIRNLGAVVPRGFIQAASRGPVPEIANGQSGRLQLAQWITSRNNPLTARVLVNRVWHWLFGAGLVRTTDNFGSTGEVPSHPELLDELAVRFMEDGWNLKRLVREMVLSHSYRQDSQGVRRHEKDPDNRLLSRMNRKRLDAECIRDAMLAAAGTLDVSFGGPNVGGATKVDSNDQKVQNLEYAFTFDDTRRSVYTAAFRNVRHPLFEVFDFADINQPISQRVTSTVATQALYLMNHPKVIEQARAAADRVLKQSGYLTERIRNAYHQSLGRGPNPQEAGIAAEYLEATVSGNADAAEARDAWARFIQALWATPEFRFVR
jgi:hypothetical protein